MEEISAGGVVILNGLVLTLKKFQGDWVLPKGRLEEGESYEETALREVLEETGIKGIIKKYIGYLKYTYEHADGEKVNKTVYYFLMTTDTDKTICPQKEEGFVEAAFVEEDKILERLRHDAERNMVKKALEVYKRDFS